MSVATCFSIYVFFRYVSCISRSTNHRSCLTHLSSQPVVIKRWLNIVVSMDKHWISVPPKNIYRCWQKSLFASKNCTVLYQIQIKWQIVFMDSKHFLIERLSIQNVKTYHVINILVKIKLRIIIHSIMYLSNFITPKKEY